MSVADYINDINKNTIKINEKLNRLSSSLNINSNVSSILELSKLLDHITLFIHAYEKNQTKNNNSNVDVQDNHSFGWSASSGNHGWGTSSDNHGWK